MKLTVDVMGSFEKEIELGDGARIKDVLDSFKVKYDFVITMLNGKAVPIDEELKNGDTLKIVTVVSGG